MSKIIFKKLKYQNFRSVGNTPIEIKLNKSRTTLISGSNGSGKTTVMSALCFGLFGRGYGNINKPSLINSINEKKLLVEVEFSIGKKEYKIVRGMKPNIFEIYENGKLINQDPNVRDYQKVLEQQILKFNYRAFTQVVMVGGGSAYTPFMMLKASDRREFIEDLLDIRIFSTMNNLVKENYKNTKDDLKDITSELKSIREKLVLQESFITKLKNEKKLSTDKIVERINNLKKVNDDLSTRISELTSLSKSLAAKVDEHAELDDTLSEVLVNNKQLLGRISKKEKERGFVESLTQCPTCTQIVSDEHKKSMYQTIEKDIEEILSESEELKKKEEELVTKMKSYQSFIDEYSSVQEELRKLMVERTSNIQLISHSSEQLEDVSSNVANIDAEVEKMKQFAQDFLVSQKRKKKLLEEQQYQEFIQQILSDSGIKTKIIRQYIPTINKLINHYLTELDFFCNFNLDEQFNETIKSRHRDTFTYENFSEGQKRRIDLAILLTWMEIAKAKNALHTNVIFLDEIDAPFDQSGSDMLHSALRSCSADNIFLISHKNDLLQDKVDDVIQFRLHNNFTELVTS